MDARRGFGRLIGRVAAAAKRWAARRSRRPTEVALLPPVGVRPLANAEPVPADPAEHAVQFAEDWYDRLEFHCRRRMRELGIPEHRVGAYDCRILRQSPKHRTRRCRSANKPDACFGRFLSTSERGR
jgi:hypothetical protein